MMRAENEIKRVKRGITEIIDEFIKRLISFSLNSPCNVRGCAVDRAPVARIACCIIYTFAHPRSPTFPREASSARPTGPENTYSLSRYKLIEDVTVTIIIILLNP